MATKIDIGKFRSIVYFRNNVNKAQKGAGFSDGYLTFLETRGYLLQQSGIRAIILGEIGLQSQWVLYCRFQTELLDNINTNTKIWVDDRCYTISSYEQVDTKRFYYKFVLNSEQGTIKISTNCYY